MPLRSTEPLSTSTFGRTMIRLKCGMSSAKPCTPQASAWLRKATKVTISRHMTPRQNSTPCNGHGVFWRQFDMAMNMQGFNQLIGDINRMANALNTADEGAPAARRILRAAAVPIDAQMKSNASRDPKIISNKLHGAISTGKVKKHKTTGLHITIGVHRKDWNDEDYYPAYVEYGHGGPAPAPAHPYVRPAFDTRQDEAFGIIRDGLLNELRK
nr:MAG TPA: hypothetical protein [Caudoviricetes sp.]